MESITLLPQDFDALDTESKEFEYQYTQSTKCPLAKAMKREGYKNVQVGIGVISADLKIFKSPSIHFDGVKRLAKIVSAKGSATLEFIVIR